jgi:hypothetical protein
LGFVSYEGFTSKPKSYATKTIYAEIVKYTKNEIKKCNSVGSTYMNTLKCPAEPKKTIEKLLELAKKKDYSNANIELIKAAYVIAEQYSLNKYRYRKKDRSDS